MGMDLVMLMLFGSRLTGLNGKMKWIVYGKRWKKKNRKPYWKRKRNSGAPIVAKKLYFIVVGIHRTVIIRVSKVIGQPTWPPVHKVKEVKNQPNLFYSSAFSLDAIYITFFIFYLFYKFHNEIFILFLL